MDETARVGQQNEAALLAQIGRCLFDQDPRITVHLPVTLATGALDAWTRDDNSDIKAETDEARTIRHAAGALALIGLAVEARGLTVGDEVAVELDAWLIGSALDAADQRGLLADLSPPDRGPSTDDAH